MVKNRFEASTLITFVLTIFSILLVILLYILSRPNITQDSEATTEEPQIQEDLLGNYLGNMTLEEKVGQLFIFGFWGTEPDFYITEHIQQRNIGGVILLGYNIEDALQISKMNTSLQELSKYPLFISIDQEGGAVSRLQIPIVSSTISQSEIEDSQQAYDVALTRGKELKALGINMNFSPVLDSITNTDSFIYNRVFRGNVTELGIAMIKGYVDSDIIPVAKHFPGHGNLSLDPHEFLSEVKIPRTELTEYMSQFKEAITNSPLNAVMVGHILFSKISNDPASLSKIFVNDVLREELGFEGLVITDDIQMNALMNTHTISEATLKAVLAGNDILMFTGIPEEQTLAYDTVLEAVRNGTISESILDEKVKRILIAKNSLFELY